MSIKGMKIAIDAGHTRVGSDTGATGIGNEYNMNVAVKELVIKKLQKVGAIALDCSIANSNTLMGSLKHRADVSNAFNAQMHICIHHNAYNGKAHGAEVEYLSPKGKLLAEAIQSEFAKLGYKDRGVQKRDNLYILKHTNAVCVLTECCFVDNVGDMKLYSAEKEASAIVAGIIKILGK